MTAVRAKALGCGHYLPDRIVHPHDLSQVLDTSDQWIRERTGIAQRHIAAEGQLTSDLAARAADRALSAAGLKAADIDAIVIATATPDQTFPSTATRVQHMLGMSNGFAYDLQGVCAGFIYAVANANGLIQASMADRVLVLGAETFSRILDWKDRSTCVLFGDGAGAIVLERADGDGTPADRGVLGVCLHSDGAYNRILHVSGGPSEAALGVGVLKMEGREVFRHAVQKISGVIEETLLMTGYAADEIDLFIPHQANARILDGIAKKLGVSPEKIIVTLGQQGNTSAASIPLALNHAFEQHRLKEGSLILMEAMGGGFTWGAVLARW